MQSKSSRRKSLIIRAIIYITMSITVVVTVVLIMLFMLGFRFTSGNLERYAFLQFNSNPTGATVSIDGTLIGTKTPNKSSIPSGKHDIVMWREGYEKWTKTVEVNPGTLTWLNYAILVPSKLNVKSVKSYDFIYSSLASPDANSILVQRTAESPVFDLIDITSDNIKTKTLTIPADSYSESGVNGVSHNFRIDKWDTEGRYVIINHSYRDKNEWLVVDTHDINQTKNITKLLDINIDRIEFASDNGSNYYVLESNDIRKIDLSAETISKPLISKVADFDVYDGSKVVTYKSVANENNLVSLGVYREGDDTYSVLRTVPAALISNIATVRYFNEDYVAIMFDKQVDILKGSYPNPSSADQNSLKVIRSLHLDKAADRLSFSPSGQYLLTQSGSNFATYDLEYQKTSSSKIDGLSDMSSLRWLDNNYLWSDRDSKLTIREFDGQNVHTINPVQIGQDAVMTKNGRYIYSIGKNTSGYQLQRVRMILQ